MPFLRPTLSELADRIQTDLTTRLPLAGAVLRRSVVGVLARVLGGAVHQLHGHLEFLSRQIFPDQSEVEFLERQAALFGVTRAAAAYATGNVTFTGTDGAGIAQGTVLRRADGAEFVVDAEVYIASGTATTSVTASVAGAAGNTDAGIELTCVSPIVSVNAIATVASGGLGSGADTETDDALRTRLITRMRQPPHGGAADDYIAWALEVPGVTRAWVYPQELGPGTVTVRFVRDDDGTGSDIVPSSGEVADVQVYIAERRPVTAAVTVVAPVAVPLDVTTHIVPDNSATRAAVIAELADLVARDGKPGGTMLRSQLRVAIGTAAGVTDFTLTIPSADVVYATGRLPVLGTVTFT